MRVRHKEKNKEVVIMDTLTDAERQMIELLRENSHVTLTIHRGEETCSLGYLS